MRLRMITFLVLMSSIFMNAQDIPKMKGIEFVGTYQTGRAPCERLPDGSRRWANTTGFNINTVVDGDIQVSYIEIAADHKNSELQLQEGAVYHVGLTLSPERFAFLKLGDEHTLMTYQDPIFKKEITNIKKK